jgi:hypothetical protein
VLLEKKRKKRFGDRSDGRRIRSLGPISNMMPFIMKTRNDANNYIATTIDITGAEKFLRIKRIEGYRGIGFLHLMVAAYVRIISQYPGINRFCSGQRIFARRDIEVNMIVKKDMKIDCDSTVVKMYFEPTDTIFDVYNKINTELEKVFSEEDNSTDKVAAIFAKIPRLLLRFAVRVLGCLDYFGIMPKTILKISPFHGTVAITDTGSIGMPAVYHHLYNFGNMPVFISFGAKRKVFIPKENGTVAVRKHIDMKVVLDERICEGFYFSQAYRLLNSILRDPQVLENPPGIVVEDID